MIVNCNPTESQHNFKKLPDSTFFYFITTVVDTGENHVIMNIYTQISVRMLNESNRLLRGMRVTDLGKKNLKLKV